jgi:hypothetical protein
MRTSEFYKSVFGVAAVYDMLLGVAFFLFYAAIYSAFNIELPSNAVYIHITAGFVFVQGLSYFFVYLNLKRNIDIVKVGLIYKSIYVALALYYWSIDQLPHLIFGIFGIIDFFFIVLFALYLKDYEEVIAQAA